MSHPLNVVKNPPKYLKIGVKCKFSYDVKVNLTKRFELKVCGFKRLTELTGAKATAKDRRITAVGLVTLMKCCPLVVLNEP